MVTREEALDRIANMTDMRAVRVNDTSRVKVLNGPEGLAIRPNGGKLYTVGDPDQLLAFTGIPKPLAKKLSPDTTARAMADVLRDAGQVTLLTKDGDVVDVAGPGAYSPLDPERVFRMVDRSVPGFGIHNFRELPHHTVGLELLGVDEPKPVPDGTHHIFREGEQDLVKAGVFLQFSPLGLTAPLVQAFAMRLVCTNGLLTNEIIRDFQYGGRGGAGEGDDVWQFFRQSTKDAYTAIDRIIERFHQMKDEGIPEGERAMVLAAMIKEAGLSKEAKAAIEARAIEHPPHSMYDAYQLITWATSHVERDPVRIVRAQRRAANFTDADRAQHRICPTCNRQA